MNATKLQQLLRGMRRRMATGLDRLVSGTRLRVGPEILAAEPAGVPQDLQVTERTNIAGRSPDSFQDGPEEVDRLVRLTFNALLRREPDQEILAAYREGFAKGITFHDLIDDVLGSDEYRAARERAERLRALPAAPADVSLEPVRLKTMRVAVRLLETRLAARGCRLRLGAGAKVLDVTDPENRRRMRGLRVTLAMLDRF